MDGNSTTTASIADLLAAAPVDTAKYETLYKHFHTYPELSNLEAQTAKTVAEQLSQLQAFDITTDIGGHGLVGVLENGPGNTILLRADIDALPIKEATGLPYASTVTMLDAEGIMRPVMHACGHDMHMACLIAAAERLVKLKQEWSGTLVVLFQPAEERGTGAKAMVDDGLYDKHKIPVPDFVLGQHVMAMRAGSVGSKAGTIMAGADSMKITLSGLGGHGSQPHRTVDPAVMAAHVVVRLQSIVSREINPSDISVITVGSLHAGQTENVIADSAEIGLDIRSVRPETREKLLASIRRVVEAECEASGATAAPVFKMTRHLPVTVNDESMTTTLAAGFREHFGSDFDANITATTISEDFSVLATSQGKPCAFWHWGGIEEGLWDQKLKEGRLEEIPANHTARFAPVIQPTLQTGIDALCVAALTFFRKKL
ncbi:amidohydrolase [Colletotrichum higginsianum]|uniref:Amidohydrolase n=2 Tax=Colletotrichum higginsianum TaxID=80884 RepID=H1V9T2_COLHI|nr:Amidohydrolase [Colletotrichum higginsianum IMI 349063]OBR08398.1 Amidohydrolase [Colletotrichum higginsianum IMI 349063]TIC95926.1 Hippurate hydrolase [Colletotrichum higginsianum]CCF36985.1 amidohydrolase [Colletotrichum higginsianum]